MQSFRMLGAIAAGAVFVAGSAFAQSEGFRGDATLAKPLTAPIETTVNGVAWRCAADKCVAEAQRYASLDSPIKECRKVAAAVGPFTAYASRGRVMTKGSLEACNTAAKS